MGAKYPALNLGNLPVVAVNSVLGTELEPGDVRLSAKAHQHMAEDHPEDYAVCIACLQLVIADPQLIGQAPKVTDNFEMLRRVNHPDGKLVLAAVSLETDRHGSFLVRSCYLVSDKQVDNRRRAGRLKPPPPK